MKAPSDVKDKIQKKTRTWWDKTKALVTAMNNWMLRYPVALIISVLVILAMCVALMLGLGDSFNVGGIIGKLFGKEEDPKDRIEVANEVPPERVNEDGDKIELGEADDHGNVQREVEILDQSKNPFRDKTKIKIKTPDGGTRTMKLPTGVEDKDVDKVIEVKPEVFEVQVVKRPRGRVDSDLLDYLDS